MLNIEQAVGQPAYDMRQLYGSFSPIPRRTFLADP
jgi:hypothetical protein